MMWRSAMLLVLCVGASLAAQPASSRDRYSIRRVDDVMTLRDDAADMTVSVLLPMSNAYEIIVGGRNLLRATFRTLDEFRAKPGLNGVPMLWPFANRLDEPAFYANGKRYGFDLAFGNVRGPIPIHGLVTGTDQWQLVESGRDRRGAWVTSRLEFHRIPAFMHQFPFAHTLTMTYRLSEGALEVRTRIDNLATEPMPVALGYHPYFQLTDSNRDDWQLDVGARTHWLLSQDKLPTGRTEPATDFFGGSTRAVPLQRFATKALDDLFNDLERDDAGIARVTLTGKTQNLTVRLGRNYRALVLFSTPASADRGFVAIEPMVGVSDALNLAQRGLYDELQSVPPGGHWQESFWITPQAR